VTGKGGAYQQAIKEQKTNEQCPKVHLFKRGGGKTDQEGRNSKRKISPPGTQRTSRGDRFRLRGLPIKGEYRMVSVAGKRGSNFFRGEEKVVEYTSRQ